MNHCTHIQESNYVTLSHTSHCSDVDDDDDAPHQLNQSNYYHIQADDTKTLTFCYALFTIEMDEDSRCRETERERVECFDCLFLQRS